MSTSANTSVMGGPQKFYVSAAGAYLGSVSSAPDAPDTYDVPADWIEVSSGPSYADQMWLFPGWEPSPSQLRQVEDAWREAELLIIAAQLDALEEAAAGEPPPDLLPGTRTQWLAYRGKVRNWKDGVEHFPDSSYRPVRPA